ncbi:F0F1 ATP synthase subunit B/delta [Gordonia hongkongensis]|uniref:Multifunctional fusion protein n=2 Tax=Gordonia TaxID=2053 RepID=A0AAX3TCE3_9ACTN|nr:MULTISPECIES: F0F1 ATP synthase subunit B/delta [Gordonia]QIK48526.1 F0F1 ATP synthase subunit B/delta [Gordonia terrae]MBN0973186.1 F0F1 ATP synthase subunit B/delta [Gordonia sp. BP-119]MBN0983219.1 F0F1 ATP synthase subunit B/delta [Gordonia sp. BP-94]WFP26598.1 F0F1 ATP synthase subunit B/delta [Gordonia hongkongensis]WGJ87269.1 F0F1 ATP synthase subunit B/delta [Gordonia sp. SMJS1]
MAANTETESDQGPIGTWLHDIGAAFDPAIFIAQLFGFAVILFLLWKYVRPPVAKMMRDRQETVRQQLAESEAAAKRVADGKQAREKAVAEAKAEAEQMQKDAAADAEAITSDIRAQADHEVKRISEHGRNQVALVRANLVRQLRTDLGLTAVDKAGELVRNHLADDSAQAASVDRVIDELQEMSSGSANAVPSSASLVGLHAMRAASRDAALAVSEHFDSAAIDLDGSALADASGDLTAAINFLGENPVLRKRLVEDDENPEGKKAMVHRLFDGKLAPVVVEVLATASSQRWSSSSDFVVGLRRQNSLIVLTAAERDGVIEQVEDELFRVSRVLEANPQLSSLLSDHGKDADKRVDLLKKLVGDKVGTHTWTLLSSTVRLLHGQAADVAVDQLAELAAARRGESVAHVVSASPLSDAQIDRLSGVLGGIYGRTISVQTEIAPELLGGLRISVGDEVIDADVATRLAKAAETLPR